MHSKVVPVSHDLVSYSVSYSVQLTQLVPACLQHPIVESDPFELISVMTSHPITIVLCAVCACVRTCVCVCVCVYACVQIQQRRHYNQYHSQEA